MLKPDPRKMIGKTFVAKVDMDVSSISNRTAAKIILPPTGKKVHFLFENY